MAGGVLTQLIDALAARVAGDVRDLDRNKLSGAGKPPIGWGLDSPHILSTASNPQQSAQNRVTRFVPIDMCPNCNWDAIQSWVSSAEAGGAGIVRTAGIYQSVDNTLPDVNLGPLAFGTFPAFTVTGARLAPFASALVKPKTGRYWLAHHQIWSTAPTTYPSVFTINNALRLPCAIDASAGQSSVNQQNNGSRYLSLSSFDNLPSGVTNPSWVVGGDSLTQHMLLRRSA